MVKVKKISWVSETSLEAIVTITDGCYELECFSQPCNLNLNEKLEEGIYCFNNNQIFKSFNNECSIIKYQNSFEYYIIGCVEDMGDCLVKVGDIVIKIEDGLMPGDIKEGDYISFYAQRLDIY